MGLLTQAEYDALFEKQGGRCAICRKQSPRQKLDADHDHMIQREMGIVVIRGLLCRRCNREAIGRLEYSDEVIKNAIAYLKKIQKLRKQYLGEQIGTQGTHRNRR